MKTNNPGKSKILDRLLRTRGLSRSRLAELCGVHYQAVAQWAVGETRITAERASQIERVTRGVIRRSELRPDLFPSE